ncbi:MAG TPA: YcxB family protein [Terriglobales bacterium]|nr:YcxB family protein [Terriglobales bacterium]
MEVTYQLTADDFRQAMKAYRKRSVLLRWAFRFGVAFVVLVVGSGGALLLPAPHSNAFQNLLPLIGLCILWLFMLWVSPYLHARSQFRGSPSAKTPTTLEAAESGIHFRSQYTDSKLAWPTFVGWAEEKTVFALLPNPKIFIAIPKRAFSLDQLTEFREMLRKNVAK